MKRKAISCLLIVQTNLEIYAIFEIRCFMPEYIVKRILYDVHFLYYTRYFHGIAVSLQFPVAEVNVLY
jgi:hypothetical protein